MRKNNTPFFSIIVPVFNVGKYLDECIESLLGQSFENFELICINDASTDNSRALLEKYASDKRVQILDNENNCGLSFTRNKGIGVAKGDYVIFVDSDDMLVEDALQFIYREIQYDLPDILYYNMEIRYEGEWAKERFIDKKIFHDYEGVFSGKELFIQFQKNGEPKGEVCRQAYRRDFLTERKILFYTGILHEDNLFSFITAMEADRVKDLNRNLYIYRKRDGSIMSTLNYHRLESLYIVFVEIWNYWKRHQMNDETDKCIEEYLDGLYVSICRSRRYFMDKNIIEVGNSADRYLYEKMFGKSNTSYVNFSGDQLERLKVEKNIYIFGAGNVAVDLIEELNENNIFVDSVLVSNKLVNPDHIFNIPILQLGEEPLNKEALVIIAILQDKQQVICDIRGKLLERGYERIICYSDI